MIDPAALRKQAVNRYPEVVQALLRGEDPFPVSLRYPRIRTTATREEILRDIAVLHAESRETCGKGITIKWRDINTQRYGKNRIPGDIFLATEYDFLDYVGKSSEVATIRTAGQTLRDAFPELAHSLPALWRLLRKGDRAYWADITRVLGFFRDHPFPERFARELPIEIPTKFIEENRAVIEKLLPLIAPGSLLEEGETFEERLGLKTPDALVECRLLDNTLSPEWKFRQFTVALGDLPLLSEVPAHTFLITENRTNFLTLPPLPGMIAIQGHGYAASRLRRAPFLRNRRLLYWGDLDAQGFEILAVLRRAFPHVESVLMDEVTWNRFSHYRVPGVRSRNNPEQFVLHLRADEVQLFESIRSANERLEQERIPHEAAIAALRRVAIPGGAMG